MLRFFTLDSFDFKEKVVGVRVDINSPIEGGKVVMNERISQCCETVVELVDSGAKVVLLAHQGRRGKKDFVSLLEHKKFLERELKFKISFKHELFSDEVSESIDSLGGGEVLLLENVRFFEGDKGDKILFSKLEKKFDFFVNDAFSVSHRGQLSVSGFKNVVNVAGRVMEKELRNLNFISDLKKPRSFVLGGAKPDDLVELIESGFKDNLVDKIFLTGVIGEVALKVLGYYLGKKVSVLEDAGFFSVEKKLAGLLKKYRSKIFVPRDVAVFDGKKRVEILVSDFDLPKNRELLDSCVVNDVGSLTVEFFSSFLNHSKSIYLKGPAGNFEEKCMDVGSRKLFDVIVKSSAFSFMGGGHSVTAASELGFFEKFSYVSLAGGALVNFILGNVLPGVDVLERSFVKYESVFCDYVVMGSNVLDESVEYSGKLVDVNLGEKIRVKKDFKKSVGGGGVNISVALSKLSAKVDYLGKHSADSYEIVKKDLEGYGVSLVPTKLSRVGCAKSMILDTGDHDRVIFTFRGQNSLLEISDFDVDSFRSNFFYLTSLSGKSFQTQLKLIDRVRRKNKDAVFCYGASSALVGKEKKLHLLIKRCDVLILNYEEAQVLADASEVSDCLNGIFKMGVSLVVMTDGANGSYVFDGDREYFCPVVKPKKVVDATGAGDCFGATFFYFYTQGYPIRKAMKLASINSSSVVATHGAHVGMLCLDEILKLGKK